MVLNKIRQSVEPVMSSLGKGLARLGVSPDAFTFIGFLLAVLAGFLYALRPHETYIAALALVASGTMDILDGAVARAMNRVSRSGSFNDSSLDRLAEVAIYTGIIYAGYTQGIYVLLALGLSLLVSYARAKGDALNVKLSGIGIGERAERLIVLIVFSFIGYVSFGIYLVLLLAAITFLQRYAFILRSLSKTPQ
ncbi:MAG: CDP-alcohol phosphatidyltransferase family protein [Nitrososphaerales archaeon]